MHAADILLEHGISTMSKTLAEAYGGFHRPPGSLQHDLALQPVSETLIDQPKPASILHAIGKVANATVLAAAGLMESIVLDDLLLIGPSHSTRPIYWKLGESRSGLSSRPVGPAEWGSLFVHRSVLLRGCERVVGSSDAANHRNVQRREMVSKHPELFRVTAKPEPTTLEHQATAAFERAV
jgi:hypothetical protein